MTSEAQVIEQQRLVIGTRGWARKIAIGVAALYVGFLLALPLLVVLVEAFSRGPLAWLQAIAHRETLSALKLSLIAVLIAVVFNTVFGIAAAWTVTKFDFPGKRLLISLIDLPLAVSPVIAGMIFVLLFGAHGWFGPFLTGHGVKVIFALPGIVLATIFVTFPFVARELIPFFEQQGPEQEEAAMSLGASARQTLLRVTIPSALWPLLYGIVLCAARSLGEFGAVSVVSGHIKSETNTLPLHIEALYNEYSFQQAFAVSSLLVGLAVLTIIAKKALEKRDQRRGER